MCYTCSVFHCTVDKVFFFLTSGAYGMPLIIHSFLLFIFTFVFGTLYVCVFICTWYMGNFLGVSWGSRQLCSLPTNLSAVIKQNATTNTCRIIKEVQTKGFTLPCSQGIPSKASYSTVFVKLPARYWHGSLQFFLALSYRKK